MDESEADMKLRVVIFWRAYLNRSGCPPDSGMHSRPYRTRGETVVDRASLGV
jgi:hypothetical protein